MEQQATLQQSNSRKRSLRERDISLPQNKDEAWEQVADVRAEMRLF
jgi:hypothetical protein